MTRIEKVKKALKQGTQIVRFTTDNREIILDLDQDNIYWYDEKHRIVDRIPLNIKTEYDVETIVIGGTPIDQWQPEEPKWTEAEIREACHNHIIEWNADIDVDEFINQLKAKS